MRTLAIILCGFFSMALSAQSVDRNDFVLSVSPGITLYNFGKTDTARFYPRSDYWGVRTPLTVEYALSRTFGVSADFVYSRLLVESMHPFVFHVADFGVGIHFHSPSDKRRIDWFGEIGFHYSKLHFSYHGDFYHETNNANGWSLYYDVGANVPLSASEKFGMGISLNGSGYNYFSAHRELDSGISYNYSLKAIGFAASLNFYYKL